MTTFLPPGRHRRSGIALVLVLSVLILLTAVVVAFFTNATNDLTASKGYSDESRVKLLASSAVNLVESQIQHATAGGTAGAPEAWASQPGMIQTYDKSGNPLTSYKLYSSDALQYGGRLSPATVVDVEVPKTWYKQPSDFVDLNSPVLAPDPNGTLKDPADPNSTTLYSARYPIVDGNSLALIAKAPSGDAALGYDHLSRGIQDIEGFAVVPQPSYTSGNAISPVNNPVPMPVRWLYQLQNGELHARDKYTQKIPNASAQNPPVSRIAFWTDDDTCKLNINTASEGQDWSPPRAVTRTDYSMIGRIFPAQNEFQMFPGHPAKNCLSTVFSSIQAVYDAPPDGNGNLLPLMMDQNSGPANYATFFPFYYDLVPRVTRGDQYGSSGGTRAAASAGTGIPYDTDRLYTSVDEIMYKTQLNNPIRVSREQQGWAMSGGGTGPAIPPTFLETTRFFLTTSNRAPEVTLLNTPRIALWPLPVQTNLQSGKERLLAFCSTIPSTMQNGVANGYPYYFQRAVSTLSNSATPGLSSDSTSLDFTSSNTLRNAVLYNYLQNLLKVEVPGLGGNFSTKYPATCQQIATEIMDQLRSGVNTWGSSAGAGPGGNLGYNYTQPRANPAEGQVTPLLSSSTDVVATPFGNTKGFGRYSTITEVALDLFRADDPNIKDKTTGDPRPIQIGAVLLLQSFNPSPGFPTWSPDYQVTVTGLNQFNITAIDPPSKFQPGPGTKSLNMNPNGTNIVDGVVGVRVHGNPTEYNTLPITFDTASNGNKLLPNNKFIFPPTPDDTIYPFYNLPDAYTTPIDPKTGLTGAGVGQLPAGTSKFDLSGAHVTIQIYANPVPTTTPIKHGTLIQTLQMDFPPSPGLPVPTYNAGNPTTTAQSPAGPANPDGIRDVFNARINGNQPDPSFIPPQFYFTADDRTNDHSSGSNGAGSGLIGRADVVRSMIVDPNGPSRGDYRIIAGLKNVPSPANPVAFFAPHPFYFYGNRGTLQGAQVSIDPNPGASDYNWCFADSLRIGDNPGYGGVGYYNYGGTTMVNYMEGSVTSGIGRKSTFAGSLIKGLITATNPVPFYTPEAAPAVPAGMTQGALMTGKDGSLVQGDWDTGPGSMEDGPYINKPDEGSSSNAGAYFDRITGNLEQGGSYSPNREVSSAVAFGSLPTGIDPNGATANLRPWQTLLFCANPASSDLSPGQHPGFGTSDNTGFAGLLRPPYRTIPDHYIMDLFTMPIVEPYAISEPLSSQGKVNMNYQIAPFTYIHRSTGLHAVLKGSRMMAIPSSPYTLAHYKAVNGDPGHQYRYDINPDERSGTLKFFEDRFDKGDIFRSASEICNVPLVPEQISGQTYDSLVPKAPTADSLQQFWMTNQLTGDNVREQPYGDIYPRLTTKSNTYTVHVRVQTLKKAPGSQYTDTFIDPNDTVGGLKDIITSEYRGSSQIERYVDPNVSVTATTNGPAFPDYATQFPNIGNDQLLGKFYKFHTISTKQF